MAAGDRRRCGAPTQAGPRVGGGRRGGDGAPRGDQLVLGGIDAAPADEAVPHQRSLGGEQRPRARAAPGLGRRTVSMSNAPRAAAVRAAEVGAWPIRARRTQLSRSRWLAGAAVSRSAHAGFSFEGAVIGTSQRSVCATTQMHVTTGDVVRGRRTRGRLRSTRFAGHRYSSRPRATMCPRALQSIEEEPCVPGLRRLGAEEEEVIRPVALARSPIC